MKDVYTSICNLITILAILWAIMNLTDAISSQNKRIRTIESRIGEIEIMQLDQQDRMDLVGHRRLDCGDCWFVVRRKP